MAGCEGHALPAQLSGTIFRNSLISSLPSRSVGVLFFVNPNTSNLDNPEFSDEHFRFQSFHKCLDKHQQISCRRFLRDAENSDAWITAWKEYERVGELEIERDKATTLSAAVLKQIAIQTAFEALVSH